MFKKAFILFLSTSLLGACGGSSSESTPDNGAGTGINEVPNIVAARPISGSLEQAGEASFERYLKNGIFSQSDNIATAENATSVMADASPVTSNNSRSFSETNTAEAGVDEADRVEYNGNTLYVATQPIWNGSSTTPSKVRLMQRNDDFSLTELTQLDIANQESNVNGLYLYEDRLSVVSSGYPVTPLMEIALVASDAPAGGFSNTIDMQIFDTSNPAETSLVVDISIDGWLVASRRIDNYVYLVSSYSAYVALPHSSPENESQRLENYQFLQELDISELMPSISIGDTVTPLNQPEDCFIPEQATLEDGYAQLLTVTKINIDNAQDIASVCLSAYADTSYMSTESLYLTAWSETGTILHKVDIGESFSYAASGEVAGEIRGNILRMSESDGYFRILTTEWKFDSDSNDRLDHHLFVLQQQDSELVTIAQLPNDEQTAEIGKPNEDIFAVRFIQDKAYIVTFERTDPLYVIDLTDNTAPVIAGELEIPGFSSYLHPLENGYLLGVGQEVELQALPQSGGQIDTTPISTGAKVSLFDVSDPANPIELSNLSFDNAYTPVEYDYRALSVLKTDNQYQFTLPLETWLSPSESDLGIWESKNSLLMLDVNAASGTGEMTLLREMKITTDQDYSWSGEDRSVIHGNNIFYVHGNQIWQSLWQADAAINGPY
jgi:uncharacterized secreted protein with C-terminal beta-propeller domain